MKPALKLDILICQFAYGGSGGVSMITPDLMEWGIKAVAKMKADPRIGNIHFKIISDTPLTMTRNRAVRHAREVGAHLILMLDSDNSPTKHQGAPWYKDFFEVAFDEIYNHYGKGPLCIGAPYCGPPTGIENVYVFQFSSYASGRGDETKFTLEQYTRAEAAKMRGVQECAALPTGMILFDMRCFELIEPSPLSNREILAKVQCGELTLDEAERAMGDGFFYYEWPDQYADQKDSTEDVVATRNIALAGMAQLGYNPVRCAWDSWVGHHKPWNVGKPEYYGVEQIANSFKNSVLRDHRVDDTIIDASRFAKVPRGTKLKPPIVLGPIAAKDWADVHETPREDIEALRAMVKEVLAEKDECRVLEVGSWLGNTAIAMADAGATVDCIDTWEGTPGDLTGELAGLGGDPGKVMQEFLNRIGDRHNKSIRPWRRTSAEAAKMPWKPFDIIFIDADHSYEATKADIEAWLPHLAEGGIICGHDYNAVGFPGVKRAVDSVFPFNLFDVERLGRTVWKVTGAGEYMRECNRRRVLNGALESVA